MTAKNAVPALPAPVIQADTVYPKDWKLLANEDYKNPHYTAQGGSIEFELWYTPSFGWCIPTLQIKAVSGRAASRGIEVRRSYAIAVETKQLVRIGHGPHVKATHRVFVKASRMAALTPLLDIMLEGSEKAGMCRDRISSRRANTALRRNPFMPWDF